MSPRRARRLPDSVPRKGRGGAVPGRAGSAAARAGEDGSEERPAFPAGPETVESWPDGDWVIRPVPGPAAVKAYRCPGCDQEIPAGTTHLVAWPALTPGLDMRRHWHRACWQRRLHRRPDVRRGR